jgi:hypothetical protein
LFVTYLRSEVTRAYSWLRDRPLLAAGFLALLGLAACVLGFATYGDVGVWPKGSEWVGIAELLVTAAGLTFAGIELSRTLETVKKYPLRVRLVAARGEARQEREAGLWTLRFEDAAEERTREWVWVARFKLYLTVGGSNPAMRFVGWVSPFAWDSPKSSDEGATWTRMEIGGPPSALGISWGAGPDSSGSTVWRGWDSKGFVLLPGDEFYAGEFEVRLIAHLEEAMPRLLTPPDIELKAFTDVSLETRVKIRPDPRGPKEGIAWVRS